MAERIPLWKKLNLSSLMIGVGCVIAGMGAASLYGNLMILSGTLCMVFAAFSQLSANMANRYYDERHSLGAGIDQKISVEPQPTATSMLKECAVAMFLLAIMVGLAILTMCGWWVLPIGLFIVVAGWLCSNGETPLMRTPLSPLVAFFLFGPVCVISSYLVQTIPDALHPIGWYDVQPAVYIGIAFGFLAANANIVYNYARYYPDLRNCRSSMVTELGRKKSRIIFLVSTLASFATALAMCLSPDTHSGWLDFSPAIVPLCINLYVWHKMRSLPRQQLYRLIGVANANVLLTALICFVVFTLTGLPDENPSSYFGL